jgi:hypothetical protein
MMRASRNPRFCRLDLGRWACPLLRLLRWIGPASAVLATLVSSQALAVGPYALTDKSEALVRAYNAVDTLELHRLLAPALQAKYPPEALENALMLCRVLTGGIFRLSTPVWGARQYGFFAVYAESKTFEMVLEIDAEERIIHWLLTDNLASNDQQCRLSYLD